MPSHPVHITKVDHHQQPKARYSGEEVFRDEEVIVVRCLWERPEPMDLGPFRLERGDIFMESYYRREWFNIMAIYDSAGILKGWYCNITGLAELAEDEIRWHDLVLDLLVLPDGGQVLLDEEEYEAMRPSDEMRAQVERAMDTLRRWVEEGHVPFGAVVRRK